MFVSCSSPSVEEICSIVIVSEQCIETWCSFSVFHLCQEPPGTERVSWSINELLELKRWFVWGRSGTIFHAWAVELREKRASPRLYFGYELLGKASVSITQRCPNQCRDTRCHAYHNTIHLGPREKTIPNDETEMCQIAVHQRSQI